MKKFLFVFGVFCLLAMAGCRQALEVVREVPVEVPRVETVVRTDTVREVRFVETDRVIDSATGDTVRVVVREWRDRYHAVRDTVGDSVPVVVEVRETVKEEVSARVPWYREPWFVCMVTLALCALLAWSVGRR